MRRCCMVRYVGRWGNSLAVRIPAELAEYFPEGSAVDVERRDGELVIRPRKPKYTLAQTLASTDGEPFEAFDWRPPQGLEAW
jgi:antitoxin MazE